MNLRYIEDFDTFVQYTGMLIEGTDWDRVGIYPDNANGSFDLSRLNELKDFCAENPRYHVLTETTDGDEFSDENTMAPVTISNRIRFMNRFEYYLGNGSKRASADLSHWTDGLDHALEPYIARLKDSLYCFILFFP